MTEPDKDEATKRGDEILRRLLKTPPTPHGKDKAIKSQDEKKKPNS